MRIPSLKSFVLAALGIAGAASLLAQSADDPAKARYDNGRRELEAGSDKEALTDLDEAVTKYPTSKWAGEALVLKAEYSLEVARDLKLARKDLDRIKDYKDVAPAAYLLSGRITMAEDRSPDK